MLTLGNIILYISAGITLGIIAALLLKELKNNDSLVEWVRPLTLILAGILTFDLLLLTYYFVASDFTYDYVWSYSSLDLPLIYKISGVWAGQQGTYLLWLWIIAISALWLQQTTRLSTPISRRTQIITIFLGLCFAIITLIQSPFKSIYEGRPDLLGYVPPDGSGLNALLINFWMIVHPPLMFIGYAAVTIPFAAALVYLLTKDEGWEELARQWARFAWLFLGLGIAVGGLWAYLVLGWGGFWSWDPVETASLIPWLTLTGFLHASAIYRKNKKTFSIAAPMLAATSFVLVAYAALVTRSGLFNSVHAFGETTAGTLLLLMVLASAGASLILGAKRYLEGPENKAKETSFLGLTNIFYMALLLFVILAFISFWGITFPVIIQLTQGIKVGIASDTKNFFNVWSYPFALLLLLAAGLGLQYKDSEKDRQVKNLLIVIALTALSAFLLGGFGPIPSLRTENFYVLDTHSPFFKSEPLIYKILGTLSLVSIFPPLAFAAFGAFQRLSGYLKIKKTRPKLKEAGVFIIHLGVVFILLGTIISVNFGQKYEYNIPLAYQGKLVDTGENGIGIKILDFQRESLGSGLRYPGTPIYDVRNNPAGFASNELQISGKVTQQPKDVGNYTYIELDDGTDSMWVAVPRGLGLQEGMDLTAAGLLMVNFRSPTLDKTFDVILFSSNIQPVEKAGYATSQRIQLEVYRDGKMIGRGNAEFVEGKGGSATYPMVDRSLVGDVYVIFQGASQGMAPLTLELKPAINQVWIGVIMFAAGIMIIVWTGLKRKSEEGLG